MNNYTYIISSLPVISSDSGRNLEIDSGQILDDIREQLDEKDRETLSAFLSGFETDNLCEDFYRKALSHKNGFLRRYYAFDLDMRNAKARYLNTACGRPEMQDTIVLGEEYTEPDQKDELDRILHINDILAREKGLDEFMWKQIGEISIFNYFDMDAILAFVAKLKIVDRWLKLDEQTGREMFRTLVGEVRSTFKGVEF